MHSDPEFDAAVQAAGLDFRQMPLEWYADKIDLGETFSLVRYGDGELAALRGDHGRNTDGANYRSAWGPLNEITDDDHDDALLYGLQRVLPKDVAALAGYRKGRTWYDSEVFGRALLAGRLWLLINTLRDQEVVVVGNAALRFIQPVLRYRHYIEVHPHNAIADEPMKVKDELLSYALVRPQTVYVLCCGFLAKWLIGRLHGEVNGWLLDLGHIFDPFVGLRSRMELENLTDEQIARNLRPC